MAASNLSARDKWSAGRLVFRKAAPYFARLTQTLQVLDAPGLGTCATTDTGVMLVDYEWVERMGFDVFVCGWMWAHEVAGHVWGRHALRRGTREPTLWNIAADLAVNPMVSSFKDLKPPPPMGDADKGRDHGGVWPADFGFDEGLTADEYYAALVAKMPPPPTGGGGGTGEGAGGAGGGSGEPGEQGSTGEPGGSGQDPGGNTGTDPQNEAGGAGGGAGAQKPEVGGGWCGSCAGRPVPNEPSREGRGDQGDQGGQGGQGGHAGVGRTPAELARAVRATAEAIVRHASKGRGDMPAGLLQQAEALLLPAKVPWPRLLRRSLRRAVAYKMGAVEMRFDGPSRRQGGLGFGIGRPVLPRMRNPTPETAFVIDTSGSMGRKETQRALSEGEAVVKSLGVPITVLCCDARTYGLQRVGSIRDVEIKGGGGTDFRPVFKALDKAKPRPALVVFATDGMGPAPLEPPDGMHVIWLLVGAYKSRPYNDMNHEPVTWGEFIEVDD